MSTTFGSTGLAIGPGGATNPTFSVDATATNVVTGVLITGAAAAGGVAITTTSTGGNESCSMSAKGAGALQLAAAGTGGVLIGNGAGYIQIPSDAAPTDSNVATNTALVLTGDAAPYTVNTVALSSGFGTADTNTGFTVIQSVTSIATATTGNFTFQRIGNIVRLDFVIGATPLANTDAIAVTINLAALTKSLGADLTLPTGGVFSSANQARGWGAAQSYASNSVRESSVVSTNGAATIVVTLTATAVAWLNVSTTISGTVYYQVPLG